MHTIVSLDFATSLIPGWHNTIFPPYFVAGAIFSGFAMVVTLMVIMRKPFGLEQIITMKHFDYMAKIMLLTGMMAPKNWGKEYEARFSTIYGDLAAKHGALLYPFFLDGVALDAKLNLQDGLHPTGPGVGIIVNRILPKVEELIGRVRERRVAGSKT